MRWIRPILVVGAALFAFAELGRAQATDPSAHPWLCPPDQHPEAPRLARLRRHHDLLQGGKWRALEEELDALRAQGRLPGDTRAALFEPLEVLSSTQNLERLDAWCAASKRHWPRLLRGRAGISHAWEARGSGFSNTVTDEGWRLFRERLVAARKHLEDAERLEPTCPYAPTSLITAAMGLGAPEPVARAAYARAVEADPGFLPAHQAMTTYLLPRWHGTPEAVGRFVQGLAEAPDADPAVLLVVAYYHEWIDTSGRHMQRKETLAQLRDIHERVLERYPRCGDAWRALGALALAQRDDALAYRCAVEGAKSGEIECLTNAGYLELFRPQTVPADRRDGRMAIQYFCRAADLGSARAMSSLGEAFERRIAKVPVDYQAAAVWFRRAAERRDQTPSAQVADTCLARLVVRGLVAPTDADEVRRRLVRAHEEGYVEGTSWLGRVTVEGKHVPQDVARGIALLNEASRKGSTSALTELGRLQVEGTVVQRDLEQGTRLLNAAAAKRDPEAHYLLGQWAKDPTRRAMHLRMSFLDGHPQAERALVDLLTRHPELRHADDPPAR